MIIIRCMKCLLSVAVLIGLLCSCSLGGNSLHSKLSSSDVTIVELASHKYNDFELLEIAKFSGNANELNARYPLECVRMIDGGYRVSYLGETSVAVIVFDSNGEYILGGVYSNLCQRSDFLDLAIGQPLDRVRTIDPEGDYPFLYTGRSDTPRVSNHYTKDGYLITIEYDTNNTVISINEELI